MRLRTNQQRHHYEDDSDPAVVNDIRNRNYEYTDNSGSYEYNPENDLHTNGNGKGIHGSETKPLLMTLANSSKSSSSDSDIDDATIHARISPLGSPRRNFEEAHTNTNTNNKVLVFGFDISHYSRKVQFIICASGVFMFSLLYGFLQELIAVQLFNRQLGLFLAMVQFMGYTIWSRFFNGYVERKHATYHAHLRKSDQVPAKYYILLAVLRAIDASMTNMAMAYVNYPAKTLLKSSRVVFTMLFSTIVSQKRYKLTDYLVVLLMVSGLVIFMHADSQSSAVFQPIGIIMLTTSLCCDAVLSNLSERIMNQYNVGQDQFIYKLYSIALVGIVGAATVRGDLVEGTRYLLTPGTYSEVMEGTEATWSVHGKIFAIILFSSTGFLGSSCSALITKEFGALTMSITSTARKATTLFLSFALFKDNVCTKEHIEGIILFITALIGKSIRASRHGHGKSGGSSDRQLNKKETSPLQAKYGEVGVNTPDSYHRNDGMVKRRKRLLGDIV